MSMMFFDWSRLFAIAATCGVVLTAILIEVDPIRWVLP